MLGDLAGKPTGELRVGLGRDMRLTAPELAARYREGMVAEGAHVLDAGMVGTEMLYYLVGSRDLDGGLMCTASHNPKAYTGAKLVERGAVALSGDGGIGDIRGCSRRACRRRPGGGSAEDVDVYAEFQEAALKFIDTGAVRPLKVVLDGGNGMAGPMVGPILEQLDGLELVRTYWEPDGEFPDHEPNPLLPENRAFIIRKVREEGADLGIAWDGDADRCFFIDETGEFVPGDFLTALLAESILQKHPGADVLYDIRASRAVADTVEAAGGRALVNRVGHAFFKARMRDEAGVFGGEVSGHYYFADFYNADSGTIPALLILELLGQKGAKLSELLEPYPRATSSRARSTPRSTTRRRRSPSSRSATPTPTSASSTASRSTTTTGTSTCARPTRSRCCGSPSSRSSPRRTWRPSATRCWASSARDRTPRRPATTACRSRRRSRSGASTAT